MALDLKVSVARDKVAGLFMSPSESPAWSAPAYVDPAAFADIEVTIGEAPTALGGTLCLPHAAEIKLEAARALAAQPGDAWRKILGAAPSYWADLNAYDPAAAAARLSRPLLIVQGDRDYQVTADDLQRFKTALAGHPNVTIREFPRLNHLFMSGDGKSRPEEYRRPGHVDAEVIETLVQFVSSL